MIRGRMLRILLLVLLSGLAVYQVWCWLQSRSPARFAAHIYEPVSYSPSGGQILLKSRFEDSFELAVYDFSRDITRRIHQSDRSPLAPSWSPDGQSLLFQSRRGLEPCELFHLTIEDSRVRKLDVPGSSSAHPVLLWSPDGRQVAYLAVEGDSATLMLIDPSGIAAARVLRSGLRRDAIYAWDPGGAELLLIPDPRGGELLQVKSSGDVVAALTLPEGAQVSHLMWDRPEQALLVMRPAGADFMQLFSLNIASRHFEFVAREEADIEGPLFRSGQDRLFYHRSLNGVTRVMSLDKGNTSGVPLTRSMTGGFRAQGLTTHGKSKQDVFLHGIQEPLDRPAYASVFDVSRRFFSPSWQPAQNENLQSVMPELVLIGSASEQSYGYLWETDVKSDPPRAVVFLHGGPKGQETPSWRASRAALIAKGWTVLALNYHGSAGVGAAYSDQQSPEVQNRDLVRGVEYIRQRLGADLVLYLEGESDGSRIVLQGLSSIIPVPQGVVLISTLVRPLSSLADGVAPKVFAFHGSEDRIHAASEIKDFLQHTLGQDRFHLFELPDEEHVFRRQSSWRKIQKLVYDSK